MDSVIYDYGILFRSLEAPYRDHIVSVHFLYRFYMVSVWGSLFVLQAAEGLQGVKSCVINIGMAKTMKHLRNLLLLGLTGLCFDMVEA
jgi:hypothetical protein